jgi:hypothetical protein
MASTFQKVSALIIIINIFIIVAHSTLHKAGIWNPHTTYAYTNQQNSYLFRRTLRCVANDHYERGRYDSAGHKHHVVYGKPLP